MVRIIFRRKSSEDSDSDKLELDLIPNPNKYQMSEVYYEVMMEETYLVTVLSEVSTKNMTTYFSFIASPHNPKCGGGGRGDLCLYKRKNLTLTSPNVEIALIWDKRGPIKENNIIDIYNLYEVMSFEGKIVEFTFCFKARQNSSTHSLLILVNEDNRNYYRSCIHFNLNKYNIRSKSTCLM